MHELIPYPLLFDSIVVPLLRLSFVLDKLLFVDDSLNCLFPVLLTGPLILGQLVVVGLLIIDVLVDAVIRVSSHQYIFMLNSLGPFDVHLSQLLLRKSRE